MSRDQVFHVRGALPIPAGHRVEVSTFALNGAPQPFDPLVRDLTTGVVYARTWHYDRDTTDVTMLPMTVRADLQLASRVEGQVRGVRIVSGLCPGESGRSGLVSTLLVAVEGSSPLDR